MTRSQERLLSMPECVLRGRQLPRHLRVVHICSAEHWTAATEAGSPFHNCPLGDGIKPIGPELACQILDDGMCMSRDKFPNEGSANPCASYMCSSLGRRRITASTSPRCWLPLALNLSLHDDALLEASTCATESAPEGGGPKLPACSLNSISGGTDCTSLTIWWLLTVAGGQEDKA